MSVFCERDQMRWLLLVVSAALALTPTSSLAHSGGTNGSGCHTNQKTGDSHCHGGGASSRLGGRTSSMDSGSTGRGSGPSGFIYLAPAPTRRIQPKPVETPSAGPVSLASVGDGDTIRVITTKGQKVTIRLACIDAPEIAQGESGAQSTSMLKGLMASGPLEIKPQTVDRFGRTVAEIYAGGQNINLEMVRLGMAYAYRQYLSGCDENAFLEAEAQAERNRQGVWRWGSEIKPWDFRKGN